MSETLEEIITRVDQQMAQERARSSKPAERRQPPPRRLQDLPVAANRREADRRTMQDRRLSARNTHTRGAA